MQTQIYKIRRENMRRLADEMGGVSALAKKLRKSQSQISQLIGERPVKSIGAKIADQIEQRFNKPRGWLDRQHNERQCYSVPVIKWEEINIWDKLYLDYRAKNHVVVESKISTNAFALQVCDDTMESPCSLSFPKNSIIIIEPDGVKNNNRLVIASITCEQSPTFKQLTIDAGKFYLKPLNPRYPVIALQEKPIIYGVVCEMQMKLY